MPELRFRLSIIIPVFNERRTVAKVLDMLESVPIDKELIVVDDYSTDGSRKLLTEIAKKNGAFKLLFHSKNSGKGACIKTALSYAKGDYVIIHDADLEQNPLDILELFEPIDKEGYEAVFGTRVLNWGHEFDIRYIANKIFALLTDIIYKAHITDIMTGYKLIKRSVLESLNLSANGFDIEPEITAKLLKRGIRIREVPIRYTPRGYNEGKKIRGKHAFSIICCLLRQRLTKT